jgi:hypothetical protein
MHQNMEVGLVRRLSLLVLFFMSTMHVTVHACSCAQLKEAGFIRADVRKLPSNARGVLFMPENLRAPKAQDFSVTLLPSGES